MPLSTHVAPLVKVHYLKLDETIKRNKVEIKGKEYSLTDKEFYKNLCDRIEYFKELWECEENKGAELRMKNLGSQRMKFLADCKTSSVKELISTLNAKERLICFAGSVEQAIELGGKDVCSSRKSSKQNKELIERYNKGETNRLFAKNMLQEGINLHNTKYGIIVQLQRKERYIIQVTGRILRHSEPQLHIFLIKDTIDMGLYEYATYRNKKVFR